VSCSNQIDATVLADYWLAALAHPEEEVVEEHLLGCDECTARLGQVIALAQAVRQLAREGSLRVVVSDTFVKRTANDGAQIREYALPPGGSVQCTVTAEDSILIARFAANLSGAKRVDLSFCDEHGIEQRRLQDIPVHGGADTVIYQESISFAKAMPTTKLIARMIAYDDTGDERLLGEYTMNHTRSLPGPGDW
jgi:hypothetical protein